MRADWREIEDYRPVTLDRAVRVLRQIDEEHVADWVRHIGQRSTPGELREQIRQLQQRNADLLKQLHKYEPPAPDHAMRSYRAGPMSDG